MIEELDQNALEHGSMMPATPRISDADVGWCNAETVADFEKREAISKPSMKNLLAYLNYQYPATKGNIPLTELCEKISKLESHVAELQARFNGEAVARMLAAEGNLAAESSVWLQSRYLHSEKPNGRCKEAYEIIEIDALARNIVHYAKNSVMPFEQVVQVTKERLEKAFREFSARPNPKPSNVES